ncbi:hypothetical protein HPP92_016971 [Vanilla planifolia]|uniref:ADP/ATP translocase n=1 Tax=Vanilla planifolia TaxID=51239 RepID=A0A835QL72_VANPL|nr:hypothetical protein HPP92_016971 [Vanilla planifolia]
MFRCIARYGYKDVRKEHHQIFEQLLIESLEKFIRREAQERSLESDEDCDSDSEEEESRSRILIVPNGSVYSADVPLLANYDCLDKPSSEASTSSFAGTQDDAIADAGKSMESELSFIHKAKESGVVYLLGHGDIRARKDSWFIKKLHNDVIVSINLIVTIKHRFWQVIRYGRRPEISICHTEVSKSAAAPIERVKLLIQNQDEMIKAGRLSEPYKGIGDCFARTVKDEGVIALWRGNTANVIRYFPTQMFNFKKDKDGYWKWFAGNLASGGMAGASSLLFVYSLDYARTRLANDAKAAKKGGERQFNGLIDVYKKTIQSDGIAGLYRGFNISCVGIIVYRGLYFGMYDSLKPVVLVGRLQDNFFASFLLGWGITIGAGLASYPIDTVRRRMMMTSGEAVKYKSSMDAFNQILKNEGAKSLFKGAGANILRAVAGAGVLAGYDKLQVLVFGKKYGSGGGG